MIWPTFDGLEPTGQPYPQGYYGFLPSVLDYIEGVLHDGYQPSKPGVAAASGVANPTLGPAWVRRQIFRADQEVTVTAYKAAASGSASDQTLLRHGVIARATGGSSAGSKPLVRYVDGSAYVMTRQSLGSGNYRFELLRYNAGTVTVLKQTTSAQYEPGTHRNPHQIRLRVTTLGDGTVQLRGYWKTYFDTQFSQVFNVIDGTASRLLGQGRCGLLLDHEYLSGSAQTISVCSLFEVTDSDSFLSDPGSLAWSDSWERSDRMVAQAFTDRWGTVGRNVLADYSSDGAGFAGYLLRQTGTGDGGAFFPTLAAYRSHSARLNGSSDYLELESPGVALRDQGTGLNRFTIAVWARIDENRDGNELYSFVDQSVSLPQRLMHWGLRVAPQINGQEAAYFELRVRAAAGSSTLATYASSPFIVEPYLTNTYAWVLTYKERADPIQGDGKVRLYVGRSSRATLLAEVSISPSHAFKLAQTNADHYIGKRFGFTGATVDTYLKGDIARVAVYYRFLADAEVDRVVDAYQTESQYAQGDALDPIGWENAWNFEDFTLSSGRNYYLDEVVGGIAAGWKDLDATTRVTGVLPQYPPVRLDAFAARPLFAAEGQSRKVQVELKGPYDRFGMLFRCRITGDDGIFDGYRVEVGEGTPAAVTVYRVLAGEYTVLGRQPAATGTRNVAVDTPFEFAAECFNLYPDRINGPAAIRVLIDGIAVPLKALDSKVSVTLEGYLVDHSVDHLWADLDVFGFGAAPTNTNVLLDDWDALAPIDAGVDVDGIANVQIPRETDGADGDLTDLLSVDWRFQVSSTARSSSMPTAAGGQKLAVHDLNEREVYEVRSVQLTEEEEAALAEFWVEHGSTVPFALDPGRWVRGHEPGVFRFAPRSYAAEQVQGGRVVSFSLVRMR